MRRILCTLVLSLCFFISLCGCGGGTTKTATPQDKGGGGDNVSPKKSLFGKADVEMQATALGESFGKNDWDKVLKSYFGKRLHVTGKVHDIQGRKVLIETGAKSVSEDEIILTLELQNSKEAAKYPKGRFVAFEARVADKNAMGPILRGVVLKKVQDVE